MLTHGALHQSIMISHGDIMKCTKTLLSCIVGCMTLLSCAQREESHVRQVLFSVDDFVVDGSTKTNCDPANNYAITWAGSDTIGIFPLEGFQEPFAIPANQVGKSSASFDGGYWDVKNGLKYNAYYPFSVENFKSAQSKTTIPVVYTGQSQTGTQCNAGAYDYTYSDWTAATDGNINFNFHHIGAFLVLSLPIPATTTYTKLTLTSLNGDEIPVSGIYDLTAAKPAFVSTAKASSLSMDLKSFSGTSGETSVFYMMLPLCDLSSSTLMVTLTSAESTTYTYSIESKTIIAGKLFEITGHEYVDLGLTSGTLWATTGRHILM